MIKIRNALVAGTMGVSAFLAPVTMPAQPASAETVAGLPSTTPVLAFLTHPCRKHKNPERCRAQLGENHGDHGDDLDDDNMTHPDDAGID
ncbi:hypothetical protein AB0B45_16665 [Nonomuraea sp. NPDC049152]|uniref:hypothetical protein n=1 Tax=Nonomuraea sp. NPDC049152 TaxID=3154350 RepID=UPI0034078400